MKNTLGILFLAAVIMGAGQVSVAAQLQDSAKPDQRTPIVDARPYLLSLSVLNLDAAVRWYQEVLGFRELRRLDLPAYQLRMSFIELNGFRIELIEYKDAVSLATIKSKIPRVVDRARVHGFGKLAFAVGDIDAVAGALKAKKAKLIRDVTLDEATGDRWLLIEDMEGNWLQFFEVKKLTKLTS